MEAIRYFSAPGVALDYVARLRWPNGPVCEKCGLTGDDVIFLKNAQRWKCRGCKSQFSVKRGSIMEDSPLSLDKWLCAIWMIANCKNGVSSYEIHRALGITQKSAWFMLHRIRLAMENKSIEKMSGPVEVDEAFFGGKIPNMSKEKRKRKGVAGRGTIGKAIVMGMLDRGKEVRTVILEGTQPGNLIPPIQDNVAPGAKVFTDSHASYRGLRGKAFDHESVNHMMEEYVRGEVHTNGIENFWSLLKRGLHGTYVNVEPFHLFRYLDEQVFRYNKRKHNDAGRFNLLLAKLAGKRLTYAALTGGMEAQTC
jgi:transposase-like protein